MERTEFLIDVLTIAVESGISYEVRDMSARTIFITDKAWRKLPGDLRSGIMAALGGRGMAVGRFVCNVESDLRDRGENRLARRLLNVIEP